MKWTTIIADASFCEKSLVGGYAYWIASSNGKYGGDGTFRKKPVNNIAAEMMALLYGVKEALESNIAPPKSGILLQTDCQAAIDAFEGRRTNISAQEVRLANWLNSIASNLGIYLRYKHVKGHSNRAGDRYVVNAICDRKARANMRKARNMACRDKFMESVQL